MRFWSGLKTRLYPSNPSFWIAGIFYALNLTLGSSVRQKPPIWFTRITDRLHSEPSKKACFCNRDITAHTLWIDRPIRRTCFVVFAALQVCFVISASFARQRRLPQLSGWSYCNFFKTIGWRKYECQKKNMTKQSASFSHRMITRSSCAVGGIRIRSIKARNSFLCTGCWWR